VTSGIDATSPPPGRAGRRARCRAEDGLAAFLLPLVLWCTVVVAVVVIDIAGYLIAASRAQALADAAALAAVSVEAAGQPGGAMAPPRSTPAASDPVREAERVTRAGGGALERCACAPGQPHARVTVSVPVQGLVAPTVVARRVEAVAAAVLAPP
jgi:hypothetical protein